MEMIMEMIMEMTMMKMNDNLYDTNDKIRTILEHYNELNMAAEASDMSALCIIIDIDNALKQIQISDKTGYQYIYAKYFYGLRIREMCVKYHVTNTTITNAIDRAVTTMRHYINRIVKCGNNIHDCNKIDTYHQLDDKDKDKIADRYLINNEQTYNTKTVREYSYLTHQQEKTRRLKESPRGLEIDNQPNIRK